MFVIHLEVSQTSKTSVKTTSRATLIYHEIFQMDFKEVALEVSTQEILSFLLRFLVSLENFVIYKGCPGPAL